jgi:DNA-3-methyladenine glycosylase
MGSQNSNTTRPMKSTVNARDRLSHAFYARPAVELAPALIGKLLVHRAGGKEYRARIVETEAYVGPHDLACHASKGRTKRTEILFGPAGFSYVYLIYGMYPMLNIVSGDAGHPEAVLIRAAEPLDDWEADLSGPGKLCRDMKITLGDNALDLTKSAKLYLVEDDPKSRREHRIVMSKRVGVDYAGDEWKNALLRFYCADSRHVSKPRFKAGGR